MKQAQVIACALAMLITGCATMRNGTTDQINIVTKNDSNGVETLCDISNEEGVWKNVTPNHKVSIYRDGNILNVTCHNSQQLGYGHELPSFDGNDLALDLIFDACIPSCIIDGANNAFYDYPENVTVHMKPVAPKSN